MTNSGNKIAFFRKKQGLTQHDLREEVFKHTGKKFRQGTISSWENGKTAPDMDILNILASIFKVSVNELYDHNEKNAAITPNLTDDDLAEIGDRIASAQADYDNNNTDEAFMNLKALSVEMLKKLHAMTIEHEKTQRQLKAVREIMKL